MLAAPDRDRHAGRAAGLHRDDLAVFRRHRRAVEFRPRLLDIAAREQGNAPPCRLVERSAGPRPRGGPQPFAIERDGARRVVEQRRELASTAGDAAAPAATIATARAGRGSRTPPPRRRRAAPARRCPRSTPRARTRARGSRDDFRAEVLVLAAGTARDRGAGRDRVREARADRLVEHRARLRLLPRGQGTTHGEHHLQPVDRLLHDLELDHRRDRGQRKERIAGVHELARRQAQHIAHPAVDAPEHRQAATAGAGRPRLGEVADVVADQRRGVLVERRDDHTAHLPRGAVVAGLVEDLDQHVLRLNVVVRARRALQRDIARLAGAVEVDDLGIEHRAAQGAQLRRHRLADRADGAEAQGDAVLPAVARQELKVGRQGEQIVGALAHEPIRLRSERRGDREHERRAGRAIARGRVAPVAHRKSVGCRGTAVVVGADDGQARSEIAPVPEVIAQRDRLPEQARHPGAPDRDRRVGRAAGRDRGDGAMLRRHGTAVERGARLLDLAPGQQRHAPPGFRLERSAPSPSPARRWR